MELYATCADLTCKQVNELLKDAVPTDYKTLVEKIKVQLPDLYDKLALEFYNPWENACTETEKYYVLVHSATEYFLTKD